MRTNEDAGRSYYKQRKSKNSWATEDFINRVQITEYRDASHALGMTNTQLPAIHKAQTPSPAGLPLIQGESF